MTSETKIQREIQASECQLLSINLSDFKKFLEENIQKETNEIILNKLKQQYYAYTLENLKEYYQNNFFEIWTELNSEKNYYDQKDDTIVFTLYDEQAKEFGFPNFYEIENQLTHFVFDKDSKKAYLLMYIFYRYFNENKLENCVFARLFLAILMTLIKTNHAKTRLEFMNDYKKILLSLINLKVENNVEAKMA